MATVNTIENRILEMDGGEFQKLCDAYLSRCGYGNPHSFGSVKGSNKVRKGTPDTFFERPNGKLVFAEYTAQKESLFKKLNGDITKCLNEKKTNVSIKKLEEIVICYTGELAPSELISLRLKCEKKGVKLKSLGISAIANDLLNHPLLVRDFLGLSIDTGQVVPLESFPVIYGKSKFATTLETKFHFREKEMEVFSKALETNDLVLVSGKAGVGKSRFALEGCRNFVSAHPEYEAYSIVSLSQNLYEDLQERFLRPGKYLILIDDANRVVKFSYFMYILRNQKDNQQIKIVVTVRDYAREKIEIEIGNYTHQSIQLERFTDEQIKGLAKDEFNINHSLYLERIVEISGGNPRIAVMICKVAVEKNTLESINDVSALYDEYFSSIQDDLQNFGETNLLRTAGIIAFLRAVDRTNEEMMAGIQKSFNISLDTFWDCAFHLHELEMVDMYENEVVSVSDQVLSTYLFYSAFFKEKVLDFSDILQNYFPMSRSKINDSLFPAVNAFDQNAIFDIIRPKIQRVWNDLLRVNDEENLLYLAESFWHLLQTEILSFIQKRLSRSQFAIADFSQLDQLDENKLRNVSIITELKILGWFRYAFPTSRNVALDILLNYLKSRPSEILQVLHVLVEDYGFDRYTYQTGVSFQKKIVDLLWEYTENGQNELYSRLFILVSGEYLKTEFHTNEMRSKMTMTMYTFILQPTADVLELRSTVFSHLFELYPKYPKYVFTVFENYASTRQPAPDEIFSNDAIGLLEFVQSNFTSQDYTHNIFVNNYLDFLENHEVSFDINLREKFQNDAFLVYRLLSENRREYLQYEFEEYQRIRKEHFTTYFANFTDIDVKRFIDFSLEIGSDIKQSHRRYEIVTGFSLGISVLTETRPDLFEAALSYYLQKGDTLDLNPYPCLRNHMMVNGKEKTFSFFSQLDYPTKKKWVFGYYQTLPPDKIITSDLFALYQLFETSEYPQWPNHLDFLLNYTPFDSSFVARVAQLILDKADTQSSAWILNSITNPYSDINKHLAVLFKDNVEVLKNVYLTVKSGKDHDDHNSATLLKILEIDPEFIAQYIEWIYTPKGENSRWHHDTQDYSLLWHHPNHHEIFKRIVELIYKKEENPHWYTELRHFFISHEEKRLDADVEQKQEELLTELINTSYSDGSFMEFLFEVIAYFPKERRSRLLFNFLQLNKKFDDFQRLELGSGPHSWSGSAVPVYQERINYLKSLLPMLNSTELLEHRNYIEQRITALENQKNLEKKRDFIGNDDF